MDATGWPSPRVPWPQWGGGYALAAGFTAALSLLLAQCMPRVEAVLTATMLSWVVYAIAAGWAFYARTAWGAWGGTLLPAMVLGASLRWRSV